MALTTDDFVIGQDYLVAATIATEVPPTATTDFSADQIVLAIRAVCDVIRNRVASPLFPNTAVEVVLQPRQFSAVCREDYWRHALAGRWFPRHVASCLAAWRYAPAPPVVPGALYYFSPISMEPVGREPTWLAGKTELIIPKLNPHYFRFFLES